MPGFFFVIIIRIELVGFKAQNTHIVVDSYDVCGSIYRFYIFKFFELSYRFTFGSSFGDMPNGLVLWYKISFNYSVAIGSCNNSFS